MRTYLAVAIAIGALTGHARADDEVLAPIAHGQPAPRQMPADPDARTWAIGATITTGVLMVATGAAYLHRNSLVEDTIADNWHPADRDRHFQIKDDAQKWLGITMGLVGVTLVSSALTGYLWTQNEPRYEYVRNVGVGITDGGGAVSLGGAF